MEKNNNYINIELKIEGKKKKQVDRVMSIVT